MKINAFTVGALALGQALPRAASAAVLRERDVLARGTCPTATTVVRTRFPVTTTKEVTAFSRSTTFDATVTLTKTKVVPSYSSITAAPTCTITHVATAHAPGTATSTATATTTATSTATVGVVNTVTVPTTTTTTVTPTDTITATTSVFTSTTVYDTTVTQTVTATHTKVIQPPQATQTLQFFNACEYGAARLVINGDFVATIGYNIAGSGYNFGVAAGDSVSVTCESPYVPPYQISDANANLGNSGYEAAYPTVSFTMPSLNGAYLLEASC